MWQVSPICSTRWFMMATPLRRWSSVRRASPSVNYGDGEHISDVDRDSPPGRRRYGTRADAKAPDMPCARGLLHLLGVSIADVSGRLADGNGFDQCRNLCSRLPNRRSPTKLQLGQPYGEFVVGSVVFLCRRIPFLYRLDEFVTYAFEVGGTTRFELVLPSCHPCCEFLVGDRAVEPAGKVTAFEMVFERSLIEMRYSSAEVVHRRSRLDAVGGVEIEAALLGKADVGVLVAVPYVGGQAIRDDERASRPSAETYSCSASGRHVGRRVGIAEPQHDVAVVDLLCGQ